MTREPVDWARAASIAKVVGQVGSPTTEVPDVDLDHVTHESVIRVGEYTELEVPDPIPPAGWAGRPEWADANIKLFSDALSDPLKRRIHLPDGRAGRYAAEAWATVLATQIGVAMGYFSTRVLAQYYTVLGQSKPLPQFIYVTPNIVAARSRFEVSDCDLVAWISLHEATHAVQFAACPWLGGLLGTLINRLIETSVNEIARVSPSRLAGALRDPSALIARLRSESLAVLLASPAERKLIAQAQAIMTVVEGHADHVMHAIGQRTVATYPVLRAKAASRRHRNPVVVVVERMLGIDLKLRQYRLGKEFVDRAVAEGGMGAFNRIWGDPENLPDETELSDPRRWLARLG